MPERNQEQRLTPLLIRSTPQRAILAHPNPVAEQIICDTDRQLRASKPETVSTDIKHIRTFIETKFEGYRDVLNGDPVSAKAMLARHMPEITLTPIQEDGKKTYAVTSRWELLGGLDQAQMVCAEGQS
ncbi:MAG TPA: hypothetical protein VJN69_03795 [Candidatus Acidoferrales bacterium]|nr:hypothetical protein [Candidatus Acidoferrales bacterium]